MKRTILFGGLGFLFSQVAGAGEVMLWHSYRAAEQQALEKTVRDFNTSHNDIKIKTLFVPYDAYLDKITAAIPHGHGPDIFIVAHDRIGGWADSGHIAPIDEFVKSAVRNRFFQKTVEPLIYRQKLYGLPTSFKSVALFYNRLLVKEPPADTDRMIELALAAREKKTSDGQNIYGLVWEHSDLYFHSGFLFGFGGRIFDERGEPVLDSAENAAAVSFVYRLVGELKLAPEDVTSIKVTSLFNAGRAAMVINGPWFRGEIDAGRVDYGVALLPQISRSGRRLMPFVGSEAILLSARASNPAEAYTAMEWLTGDEPAKVRMIEGLQPVANIAAYQDPRVKNDPILQAFREQLKHAVPMPNTPEMQLVWVPMNHALVNAITGRATAEQALREAQLRVSQQLTSFREGRKYQQQGEGRGEFLRALAWALVLLLVLALATGVVFFRRLKELLRQAWAERSAYAYIAPAMLAIGLLVFVPFAVGVGLSFFRHYQGEYYFVGLKNFIDILASREYSVTDPFSFYYKLFITLVWTATNVFIHLVTGLGLALLLKDPLMKLRRLYRVLLIIPWAIPNYITAIIWRGMFDADEGVINHLLGIEGFSWWNNTFTAFLANLVTNCWLGFPFMMVVSLGALQSIPQELYEAAEVDGAGRWHRFRHITLPLLKPALFPAAILGCIWTFNMFNVIYLVSRGAPNGSTDILVIEAFRWAFERGERYGYAAAYSTLIFIILLIYTLITNRVSRATEGAFE